jgi:CheY-like chemotaxis protein
VDRHEFRAVLQKPLKPSLLFDNLIGMLEPALEIKHAPTALVGSTFDGDLGKRLPLRILLAEDNATNQKLALRLLARLGYEADLAGNGLEALEAMEKRTYDVVLMDMQMPEMDGLEATRQIHHRWNEDEHPYIIAMTANAMEGDRQACFAAGMDDYVSKPVRVEALVAALENGARTVEARRAIVDGVEGADTANVHPVHKVHTDPAPTAVLDDRALVELRAMVGDDMDFLTELVSTLREDAPKLLAAMRTATEAGDASGLRIAAHSLKSNAAQFGALHLAELCRKLEHLARDGALTGASDLLAQAESEYPRVERALAALVAG